MFNDSIFCYKLSYGRSFNRSSLMKNIELVAVITLSIAAIFSTTYFLKLMFFSHSLDAAGMVDLIGSIADGRGMVSPTFSSFYSVWSLLGAPSELYCRDPFISLFIDANFARWHPYLIAYPMAALTKLPGFDALTSVTLMLAISLIGGLSVIYWYLRRQRCEVWAAVLFVTVVFLFQPWAGNLIGQFYFDRLFFLPALVLIFTVHERLTTGRGNWLLIVMSTVACILISERPAIMSGGFLIAYTVFYHGPAAWRSRDARILIGLGLCAFLYVGLYVTFVLDSKYYSSFGLRNFIHGLEIDFGALRPQSEKMIAILLPMLILSVFNWRTGLVAVGAILPNFLITVGGAEKIGITTHYHTPYLPFLVAAAALGLVRLNKMARRARGVRSLGGQALLGCSLIVVGAYGYFLDITNLAQTVSFTAQPNQSQFTALLPIDHWSLIQSAKLRRNFTQQVAASIPVGANVSASDWVMPALVDRGIKLIDFAPIGLGVRDFLIMEYNAGETLPVVPSYMTGKDLQSIRRCVDDRVRAAYDQLHEIKSPNGKFTIFSRRKNG